MVKRYIFCRKNIDEKDQTQYIALQVKYKTAQEGVI